MFLCREKWKTRRVGLANLYSPTNKKWKKLCQSVSLLSNFNYQPGCIRVGKSGKNSGKTRGISLASCSPVTSWHSQKWNRLVRLLSLSTRAFPPHFFHLSSRYKNLLITSSKILLAEIESSHGVITNETHLGASH